MSILSVDPARIHMGIWSGDVSLDEKGRFKTKTKYANVISLPKREPFYRAAIDSIIANFPCFDETETFVIEQQQTRNTCTTILATSLYGFFRGLACIKHVVFCSTRLKNKTMEKLADQYCVEIPHMASKYATNKAASKAIVTKMIQECNDVEAIEVLATAEKIDDVCDAIILGISSFIKDKK